MLCAELWRLLIFRTSGPEFAQHHSSIAGSSKAQRMRSSSSLFVFKFKPHSQRCLEEHAFVATYEMTNNNYRIRGTGSDWIFMSSKSTIQRHRNQQIQFSITNISVLCTMCAPIGFAFEAKQEWEEKQLGNKVHLCHVLLWIFLPPSSSYGNTVM